MMLYYIMRNINKKRIRNMINDDNGLVNDMVNNEVNMDMDGETF